MTAGEVEFGQVGGGEVGEEGVVGCGEGGDGRRRCLG